MLAILRRTHWPSPFWHLALCSLVVADELLELFALVLERNRFRPEQLPACEQRPRQRNHLNLSNTLIRSTSNLNDFHVPFVFSRPRIPNSVAFALKATRPSRPRICSTAWISLSKSLVWRTLPRLLGLVSEPIVTYERGLHEAPRYRRLAH